MSEGRKPIRAMIDGDYEEWQAVQSKAKRALAEKSGG